MGAQQPFLYPPTHSNASSSTVFDPKPVTRASYAPKAARPQKQAGPLLNFNRHPDSYRVVPYGRLDAKPMVRGTKHGIRYSRKVQLLLRVLELLGTIGILVVLICVRGIDGSDGWLIRAPPAIGVFHIMYGLYHLARPATGRTPATSYSYALFSTISDAALLPFYVWTLLLSRSQYGLAPSMDWTSIFADALADKKIVWSIFLFSAALTGLHGISLLIDLYLAIVFRKIARLPPDMNPLEGHLTRRDRKSMRKQGGHTKAKDSTASLSVMSEKHLSSSTVSTIPDLPPAPPRTVPFMHTRTGSTDSLGRQPLGLDQPPVDRASTPTRSDLPSQRRAHQGSHTPQSSISDLRRSRPQSTHSPLPPPNRSSVFRDMPVSPAIAQSPRGSYIAPPNPAPTSSTPTRASRPTSTAPDRQNPYRPTDRSRTPRLAYRPSSPSAYDDEYREPQSDDDEQENRAPCPAPEAYYDRPSLLTTPVPTPALTVKKRKTGYEALQRIITPAHHGEPSPVLRPAQSWERGDEELHGRSESVSERGSESPGSVAGGNWDRIPPPLAANPLSPRSQKSRAEFAEVPLNAGDHTPSLRYEGLRAGRPPVLIGGKARGAFGHPGREERQQQEEAEEEEMDLGDGRARNVSGIAVEEGRGGGGWTRLRKVSGLRYL